MMKDSDGGYNYPENGDVDLTDMSSTLPSIYTPLIEQSQLKPTL